MFKTFLYTAALTTVLALEPARKTWNKKLLIMTLKVKFVINIAQDKNIPFHRFWSLLPMYDINKLKIKGKVFYIEIINLNLKQS